MEMTREDQMQKLKEKIAEIQKKGNEKKRRNGPFRTRIDPFEWNDWKEEESKKALEVCITELSFHLRH